MSHENSAFLAITCWVDQHLNNNQVTQFNLSYHTKYNIQTSRFNVTIWTSHTSVKISMNIHDTKFKHKSIMPVQGFDSTTVILLYGQRWNNRTEHETWACFQQLCRSSNQPVDDVYIYFLCNRTQCTRKKFKKKTLNPQRNTAKLKPFRTSVSLLAQTVNKLGYFIRAEPKTAEENWTRFWSNSCKVSP